MNILTEEQALDRQLLLPRDGLFTSLPEEFVVEIHGAGTFVEYNQQVICGAGELLDFICCIVAGRVQVSRLDANYAKRTMATLSAGDWFGEATLFLRQPSKQEIAAEGEVVLWTISPDILRQLCFEHAHGVQLLFNLGTLLAQKVVR